MTSFQPQGKHLNSPLLMSYSLLLWGGQADCKIFQTWAGALQPFFAILAQVSFSVTVRLKTNLSGVESRSTQKYPWRSNW